MLHFSDDCSSQGWAKAKPRARSSSPTWVTETQVHGPPPPIFSGQEQEMGTAEIPPLHGCASPRAAVLPQEPVQLCGCTLLTQKPAVGTGPMPCPPPLSWIQLEPVGSSAGHSQHWAWAVATPLKPMGVGHLQLIFAQCAEPLISYLFSRPCCFGHCIFILSKV